MSNANDPKAAPPPSSSAARPASPPGGAARPATPAAAPAAKKPGGFRLDPAAIMLGVGGAVLIVALWILWTTPRSDQGAAVDEQRLTRIEQRLTALEPVRDQAATAASRVQAIGDLETRLRTLEQRPAAAPAPDLAPLRAEIAAIAQRVAAAEQAPRPAAAPTVNTDQFAPRQAVDALATRIQGVEASTTQAVTARLAALEQQLAQRVTALEQQLSQRSAALEQQLGQRAGTLEQQVAQRTGALEQQIGQRLAAVDQSQQRVAAIDQRTTRIAAIEHVQAALDAGQPLGAALGRLQNPPEALTRFASAAPPTAASLRLSFEEAARAARAAADPGTAASGDRGTVADAAISRLSALVTVRRGEQVLWGDAAEGEIEKARRALHAGDIALALTHIEKLPPSARQAMEGWSAQAKALLAARAALRQMVAAG